MKILRIRFPQWAMVLVLGLAVTGYPLHVQAMSLFMGGEEPKTAPAPPKPITAKPQSNAGQPGSKPPPPVSATQSPTPGSQAPPALSPVPGSPATGVSTPKPVVAQPLVQTPAPGAAAAKGIPGPSTPAADASKNTAAQPVAPLVPSTPSVQAAVAPQELPKSAANAPTPAAAVPAKALVPAEIAEGYSYDPKSRRDPFQSLTRLVKVDKSREQLPPLQRVQISDLKVLGIMWGGLGYYGLVQTPDGKGYTVKEGMLMGTNNGVIATITDKSIIVSEPGIDVTGKKSTKDVELLLRPKEVS